MYSYLRTGAFAGSGNGARRRKDDTDGRDGERIGNARLREEERGGGGGCGSLDRVRGLSHVGFVN